MTTLEIILTGILGLVTLLFILYVKRLGRLHQEELTSLDSKKRSLSTVYGKTTEQFAPFMERYPFNSQDFRFIGTQLTVSSLKRIRWCSWKSKLVGVQDSAPNRNA